MKTEEDNKGCESNIFARMENLEKIKDLLLSMRKFTVSLRKKVNKELKSENKTINLKINNPNK